MRSAEIIPVLEENCSANTCVPPGDRAGFACFPGITGGTPMERKSTLVAASAISLLAACHSAAASDAKSLKEQVVGTWSLVSLTVHQTDKKVELFGEKPRGIQIMDPNGRFVNIITRSSLPLYAGNNRMQGTAEEYTAIGKGSNALYGTYEVDEENQTVTFNVEVSTFPNWEGEKQRRESSVEGDVWRYTNPMTTIGDGHVEVVWKRLD
ncbi:lipocalin-like domain-containing protein [Neoaquamicrobium sediminum]